MALPINHLKRTLDRCCGQWEFLNHDEAPQYQSDPRYRGFVVKALNTGVIYRCNYRPSRNEWEVDADTVADSTFLSSRLNGLKRNDAGDVEPIFETPDKVAT